MTHNKYVLVLILGLSSCCQTEHGQMSIYHFDVGQADSTLIESEDIHILIDAGHWQRNDVIDQLHQIGVEQIQLMILTHPHADHIGQASKIIKEFEVSKIWMSGWEHDTQTYDNLVNTIENDDISYYEPRVGKVSNFGEIIIEVINPIEPLSDIHDNIAVRVVFDEFTAIYTGDAEAKHELEMVNREHQLDAQVLQLGHHGSRNSSTEEFLRAISPEVAIYSAGEDNQYGHPHEETIRQLKNMDIKVYGTPTHGTIIIHTDGSNYTIETN